MMESFLEKGLNLYSRKFGRRSKSHYFADDAVNARIGHYRISTMAVLIDETTSYQGLGALNASVSGVFSFSLDMVGTEWEGHHVQPLLPGKAPEYVDGWLMSAGNQFANYSLNQYLLENGCESQCIVKHVNFIDGTKYYSYIDFFSSDQTTSVQIHNYFKRCYGIPFPLDLQLTLRKVDGAVLETKQIIIAPNATRVLSCDDFTTKDFTGYLEVEFDVSSRVNKFLHYYATYSSRDFISNNHQSGLGLHPAGSTFTRGFIPEDEGETLVVCIFQKDYASDVVATALLQYHDGTMLQSVARDLKPVRRNGMLFQDMKELFSDIDFTKTRSPIVKIHSVVPLDRPNYYYAKRGMAGFYDISHAGPDPKVHIEANGEAVVSPGERQKLQEYGCSEMELKQFILPERTGIEALLGFAGDATCAVGDFLLEFHREDGELAAAVEHSFNFDKERFVDLRRLSQTLGLEGFSGAVSLKASPRADKVPVVFNAISAYRHVDRAYLTTTAASGGSPDNTPFYYSSGPPNYLSGPCSTGVTEIYGPAFSSELFDTYFCLTYPCANRALRGEVDYEIQVYNSAGKSRMFYRKIAVHGTDYFSISDLLAQQNLESVQGSYMVWFFAAGVHLYGQRILLRKSDNAIAVEHCYPGKYGI